MELNEFELKSFSQLFLIHETIFHITFGSSKFSTYKQVFKFYFGYESTEIGVR